MNDEVNYDIRVNVSTQYIEAESNAEASRFVFAYTITITNQGDIPAKLLSRHWIITDANNRTQEVKGKGVIGEQPYLTPGQSFQYTSGTMLETPVGSMQGTYQMIADDDHHFDAIIEPFSLALPRMLN
ncbi:MAG TPA: Co2+/Mg2+ efflux protein ApaG [Leucothrix sp.]|nr:Co2+/Mg2+ efflux protein ApaG [Leucothrix sp.]